MRSFVSYLNLAIQRLITIRMRPREREREKEKGKVGEK